VIQTTAAGQQKQREKTTTEEEKRMRSEKPMPDRTMVITRCGVSDAIGIALRLSDPATALM
jgi:hypothetical protein